jgi:hypothetical protein
LAALLYRALASGPPPAPAPTSAALAHHRWRDGATLFLPLRLFRRPDPFTTCHRLTAAVAAATTIISNAVVDVNMEAAHNIFDEMPVRYILVNANSACFFSVRLLLSASAQDVFILCKGSEYFIH